MMTLQAICEQWILQLGFLDITAHGHFSTETSFSYSDTERQTKSLRYNLSKHLVPEMPFATASHFSNQGVLVSVSIGAKVRSRSPQQKFHSHIGEQYRMFANEIWNVIFLFYVCILISVFAPFISIIYGK